MTGITQFWSVLGPYDYAAIKWAYGDFEDQAALDAFAQILHHRPGAVVRFG